MSIVVVPPLEEDGRADDGGELLLAIAISAGDDST